MPESQASNNSDEVAHIEGHDGQHEEVGGRDIQCIQSCQTDASGKMPPASETDILGGVTVNSTWSYRRVTASILHTVKPIATIEQKAETARVVWSATVRP